jgi:CCR4-NOT transcriptional complex subunit CAF120
MGVRRTFLEDGTEIRRPPPLTQQPTGNRQTIWAQALNPGGPPEPARDTFVQMDDANKMTKAFTPQGLLSAGLQDKHERSAKHQELIARENGASLINVANKPPPPQTGLLGAITAHERERKREGGMGAALTERERNKRVAEDQQRRFDDQQRQQFEQMQMYGSQYGGYNPMMLNSMMGMNPMMMGMNPMMTGQGMNPMMTGNGGMNPMMTGFPGMMQGYNPQQMFAAQQAAQAYQQAMMTFSTAGSQAGGGDSPGGQTPMNPMMTGGGMSMFDPRMSMMGGGQMGGPMSMMGGGQMSPMPMQMTGQSTFDPQFGGAPQFGGPQFQAPNSNGGTPTLESQQQSNQYLSGASSPARGGSPLRGNSRPSTPK